MQAVARAGQGARGRGRRRSRPSSTSPTRRCRTRRIRPPPTRTRCCASGAPEPPSGRDHLELAGAMIDMEAGSKVAGSRFAFLKGDLVFLELALVRWVMELLRGHGFEPVIPPVLVQGGGAVRHRLPARHRAADLPPGRRSAVPDRHVRGAAGLAARRRDHGRGAAPLRRLLALLPARGGRRGQGHARHLPRAPVRQGRDVLVRRAGASRRPSTSGCWRSRRRSSRGSEIPYRVVNIAVDDLGGSRGQEVRPRGLAAVPAAVPRGDVDVEHDRLPVAPARHPLPPGRRPARSTSTR